MGIAKRHVGHGNVAVGPRKAQFVLGHGNLPIRQGRPAYGAEVVELHDQSLPYSIEVRNLLECPSLASLRALPIARMEGGDIPGTVTFARNRSGNAGIHPPAKKHHGLSLRLVHKHLRARLAAKRPWSLGPRQTCEAAN